MNSDYDEQARQGGDNAIDTSMTVIAQDVGWVIVRRRTGSILAGDYEVTDFVMRCSSEQEALNAPPAALGGVNPRATNWESIPHPDTILGNDLLPPGSESDRVLGSVEELLEPILTAPVSGENILVSSPDGTAVPITVASPSADHRTRDELNSITDRPSRQGDESSTHPIDPEGALRLSEALMSPGEDTSFVRRQLRQILDRTDGGNQWYIGVTAPTAEDEGQGGMESDGDWEELLGMRGRAFMGTDDPF